MFIVYGIIAFLVITLLIVYVYIKNQKYGIVLALVSISLIIVAAVLYLSEDQRVLKSEQKILPQQIRIENPVVQPAYGRNYKVTGKITNLSERYRLTSILLKLTQLKCREAKCSPVESHEKRVKVWLNAQDSKEFETYIGFEQLAQKLGPKEWQLEIVSSQAK